MINDIAEASLLYDFYGELLSKRQKQVMELYHEENYSLSEIAEEIGISRQGVYDALKNAERSLRGYEDKLNLVDRFTESVKAADAVTEQLDALIEERSDDAKLTRRLKQIRKNIERIEL